ncbi:hypothetical protein D3C75_1132290 [compost metagenome]
MRPATFHAILAQTDHPLKTGKNVYILHGGEENQLHTNGLGQHDLNINQRPGLYLGKRVIKYEGATASAFSDGLMGSSQLAHHQVHEHGDDHPLPAGLFQPPGILVLVIGILLPLQ